MLLNWWYHFLLTKLPRFTLKCIKYTYYGHSVCRRYKKRQFQVQVSSDSQVLNAILEIKNKCLTMQEKKDEAIAKLNRKINELQEKINKDNNARKTAELEFEKKTANFKFQIQKLKLVFRYLCTMRCNRFFLGSSSLSARRNGRPTAKRMFLYRNWSSSTSTISTICTSNTTKCKTLPTLANKN